MIETGIKGHHEQIVTPHNGDWKNREYKNWQKLFQK